MNATEKAAREAAAKALKESGNETAARWIEEGLTLAHPAEVAIRALLPMLATPEMREWRGVGWRSQERPPAPVGISQ